MTPDQFVASKNKVEQLKKSHQRAQGSLDTQLKRLSEDFSCKSVAEAKDKIDHLITGKGNLVAKRQTKLDQFEKNWKDQLTSE